MISDAAAYEAALTALTKDLSPEDAAEVRDHLVVVFEKWRAEAADLERAGKSDVKGEGDKAKEQRERAARFKERAEAALSKAEAIAPGARRLADAARSVMMAEAEKLRLAEAEAAVAAYNAQQAAEDAASLPPAPSFADLQAGAVEFSVEGDLKTAGPFSSLKRARVDYMPEPTKYLGERQLVIYADLAAFDAEQHPLLVFYIVVPQEPKLGTFRIKNVMTTHEKTTYRYLARINNRGSESDPFSPQMPLDLESDAVLHVIEVGERFTGAFDIKVHNKASGQRFAFKGRLKDVPFDEKASLIVFHPEP